MAGLLVLRCWASERLGRDIASEGRFRARRMRVMRLARQDVAGQLPRSRNRHLTLFLYRASFLFGVRGAV